MRGFPVTVHKENKTKRNPHNRTYVNSTKKWTSVVSDWCAEDQLCGLSGSNQHGPVHGGEVCAGLSALCPGDDWQAQAPVRHRLREVKLLSLHRRLFMRSRDTKASSGWQELKTSCVLNVFGLYVFSMHSSLRPLLNTWDSAFIALLLYCSPP